MALPPYFPKFDWTLEWRIVSRAHMKNPYDEIDEVTHVKVVPEKRLNVVCDL